MRTLYSLIPVDRGTVVLALQLQYLYVNTDNRKLVVVISGIGRRQPSSSFAGFRDYQYSDCGILVKTVCPPARPSVCLSVCLYVCLSVC